MESANVPTTTRIATSSAVPPSAPPMLTSLIRACSASRNSTLPRSSPVWASAVPLSAADTSTRGNTPIALTCPVRPDTAAASVAVKKIVSWPASACSVTPETRYCAGPAGVSTFSRAPGARPASASTTTSSAAFGACPEARVKGVSTAEFQPCPCTGSPDRAGSPSTPVMWTGKVTSVTTFSTPSTARSFPASDSGIQARSAIALALCLVLPFDLRVVSCTY
jgi:hypothetical protein